MNDHLLFRCFHVPQEPRAFPKLPEFNAEEELNEPDMEPIYNGGQLKRYISNK